VFVAKQGIIFNRNVFCIFFDMSTSIDQEFLSRKEWRKWLEENYSSKKEIWVVIYKKKSGKKGLKYQEAVEEAVCFGWIDSKMQSIDEIRFRQRFSPRKKNSIWSKNNKELAEKMIQLGKMTKTGFETINEAKRNGKWDAAYSSKMPLIVPEDLSNALKENKLAWKTFNEFSNSTKLRYIYWVESAKKNETRSKRIIEVVKRAS
jgi:uncharacterized protein YdeI (YjbR/CyaY-like superfamily)